MADAPKTTTRPSRARTAKPVQGVAAPAEVKAPAAEQAPTDRFTVDLIKTEPTVTYEKFLVSRDLKATDGRTGVAGTIYAPPGTVAVKVLFIGATDPFA